MIRLIYRTEQIIIDSRHYLRISEDEGPAQCWIIMGPLADEELSGVLLPGEVEYGDLEYAYDACIRGQGES